MYKNVHSLLHVSASSDIPSVVLSGEGGGTLHFQGTQSGVMHVRNAAPPSSIVLLIGLEAFVWLLVAYVGWTI